MSQYLHLSHNRAYAYLKRFASGLENKFITPAIIDLSEDIAIGKGHTTDLSDDDIWLKVGIKGIPANNFMERLFYPISKVDDLSFVWATVSLYHEYGHYFQRFEDRDIYETISRVSVYGNRYYYEDNWKQLPHEIRAEATGFHLAYDALVYNFPKHGKDCLLDYIDKRSDTGSYILPKGANYDSYENIMSAFKKAKFDSLNKPRTPHKRFLQTDDESVQLLLQGCSYNNRDNSPNAYHISKLIDTMPGEQKDRMMAALVLYLHPELYQIYPELENEFLSIENEFDGIPLTNYIFDLSKQNDRSMVD